MERLEQIREDIYDLSCRYYKSKPSFPELSDPQIRRIADSVFVKIMDISLAGSIYNRYTLHSFSDRMFAKSFGYDKYDKSAKVENLRKSSCESLRRVCINHSAVQIVSEYLEAIVFHERYPEIPYGPQENNTVIIIQKDCKTNPSNLSDEEQLIKHYIDINTSVYNYMDIAQLIYMYWESNGLGIQRQFMRTEPFKKSRSSTNHPLMDICNKLADIIEGIPNIEDDELFTASCLALNRIESSYNLIMMKNLVSMYSPSFLESHFTQNHFSILFRNIFYKKEPGFSPYVFHSEDIINYLIMGKNEDTSYKCQALMDIPLDVYNHYYNNNYKNYVFNWDGKDLEYSRRFFMHTYLTQNWFDNTVSNLRSNVIQGTENQEKISYDFFRTFYLNTIFNGRKEAFDVTTKMVKEIIKKVSIKKMKLITN